MSLFKKVLEDIDRSRERLREGKVNAIPFGLPRMDKYVPGIIKECQSGVTTVTGSGKTILTTEMIIRRPFSFWMENKENKDIDFHGWLACLEDSREITMKRLMIKALWTEFGIRLDMNTMHCYYEDRQIDDEIRRAMDKLEPYFEVFENKVTFIDQTNPTAIYSEVKSWLLKPENGYLVNSKGHRLDERGLRDLNEANKKAIENRQPPVDRTSYRSTNDSRFDVLAVDTMNNLSVEKGADTKWDACDLMCRVYGRENLVGKYKMFTWFVCQQSAVTEEAKYTNDGDAITAKYVPSLANIGEYRNVPQTCHYFYGLFNPYRYLIEAYSYMNSGIPYDISLLQDFYRCFYILKSNFVETNVATNLLMDGVSGTINELPKPGTPEMTKVYDYVSQLIDAKKGLKPLKIN